MKKIFETIGFISLVCFSFFYTNRISTVIKENDDLLKLINDLSIQYEIKPIDALIKGDEIIPGLSGSSVDIKRSYNKMKKLNSFNDKLLMYKKTLPNISINKVYDKYITSGNESKKEVSLIFLPEKNEDISEILRILDKYSVKANFFVTIDWFSNNNELIPNLINNNHNIGNASNSLKSDVNWMNAIVSKINNQFNTYCYNDIKNNDYLNVCKLNTSYTIIPSIKAFDNPFIQIKNSIKNGSIISLKINDKTIRELPLIIEYIKSKGIDIVNIQKLIEE